MNRYYQGPETDHFDGVLFFHPGLRSSDKSLWELLKWRMNGKRTAWPEAVHAHSGIRFSTAVSDLRITHVGHASLLIQVAGLNILVDPVWAERASPLRWAGPRRRNPPAVRLQDLPPIQVILVTHNHYDHLDVRTIRDLWEAHHPTIIAPLGNDAIMRSFADHIKVETGDWWQAFPLSSELRVTIVPSYHWSSRTLRDRRMALWGGFVLEAPAGVVYCAGDTAYRDGAIFRDIGERFGPPIVAVLPIGGYAPRWFMKVQHANPREALQIASACGAQQVLGIHWDTFPLTDEPYNEPPQLFATYAQEGGFEAIRAQALRPGDVWSRHRPVP